MSDKMVRKWSNWGGAVLNETSCRIVSKKKKKLSSNSSNVYIHIYPIKFCLNDPVKATGWAIKSISHTREKSACVHIYTFF